jgi:hypothetical protein
MPQYYFAILDLDTGLSDLSASCPGRFTAEESSQWVLKGEMKWMII